MPKQKPLRWADSRSEEATDKEYRVVARYSDHGKTRVTIECPFCEEYVTAYVWSLCGGGKRCTKCKALFGSFGLAYQWKNLVENKHV